MSRRRHDPEGPSLEAVAGLGVGLFVAYLSAEAALPGDMHPIHWLIAAVGAVIGYLIGALIFRAKERRDLHGTFFKRPSLERNKVDHRRRPRRRNRR